MMRASLLLPLILLVGGAGCLEQADRLLSSNYYLTPELDRQNRQIVEQSLTDLATQLGFATKIFQEQKRRLDIRMGYPELQAGGTTSSRDTFNAALKEYVDATVLRFKEDFDASSSDPDAGDWSLTSNYRIPYSSPSLVSVVIDGSVYQGGAHPNSFYRTFLYRVQEESFVSADEVFADQADLKASSEYAIAELLKRSISDPSWIADGAGPSLENYGQFYMTSDGIAVIFSPYQVAAYAAGPQEVLIPWDAVPGLRATLFP